MSEIALSELWILEEGIAGQIIVGKEVRPISWKTVKLDVQMSQEILGEIATIALENYLQAEQLGVNMVVRSGMPPEKVEPARAKANVSRRIFERTAHRSIESVIESRPK